MRTQLLGPLLTWAKQRGAALPELLAARGLPPDAARQPELVLPLSQLRSLCDALARAAADPWLGLHVGLQYPRGRYGLLEYSCRSAPDVQSALRRLARYIRLLNELVVIELAPWPGGGILSQRIPGQPICLGRHANEFFIASVLSQTRALAGHNVCPLGVWLAHPAPPQLAPLRQLCGAAEIRFGAEVNALILRDSDLERPLSSADPPLLALMDAQAEVQLARRAGSLPFVAELRERLRGQLIEGPPALPAAARAMGMSARSLQRRLAAAGTTYQAELDGLREELARIWVAEARRPLGEVAYMLGYSELRAFLRAFKRWTGCTAREFRG